jgi:hypothetical protein
MAKSEFITVPADQMNAVMALAENGKFGGVSVIQRSDTEIELYAGNRNERSRFQELVARAARTGGYTGDDAITERQAAFLRDLVARDPGAAMTIGVSPDGAALRDGLTKREASRYIELLKTGI